MLRTIICVNLHVYIQLYCKFVFTIPIYIIYLIYLTIKYFQHIKGIKSVCLNINKPVLYKNNTILDLKMK